MDVSNRSSQRSLTSLVSVAGGVHVLVRKVHKVSNLHAIIADLEVVLGDSDRESQEIKDKLFVAIGQVVGGRLYPRQMEEKIVCCHRDRETVNVIGEFLLLLVL